MITIRKEEFFLKDAVGESPCEDMYKVSTPWIRLKTSKGNIELPLSENYTNDWYSLHFRKFEEMATGARMNISYDFDEE